MQRLRHSRRKTIKGHSNSYKKRHSFALQKFTERHMFISSKQNTSKFKWMMYDEMKMENKVVLSTTASLHYLASRGRKEVKKDLVLSQISCY